VLLGRLFRRADFPAREDLPRVVGLGLLGVFLVQILVIWGLHYTTAFHSALIMATIPILTMLLSVLTGREAFHWRKMLGIALGFAGVSVLLFFTKSPGTPLPETYLQGDLIVLANAMAFSWFLLGSQKVLQRYSSFSFMAYCCIVSAALYLVVFLGGNLVAAGRPGLDFLGRMAGWHWALVAYVVAFASIGSYTLNNYALRRVSPTVVAIYIFIQPVVSAITAYYLLGEPFNLAMASAAVITFAGVMLATTAGPNEIRRTD
jgi:drug/metabolite transporter (DMT)-like permease